ncbi:MAG: sulfotransferase [Cyclobacteriaceae bacterium]
MFNRIESRYYSKSKVFCIGLNKTGTTSIGFVLQELGLKVGDESKAKTLLTSWINRDFKAITNYCKSADAFQDSPFSFPYTYIFLKNEFPDSRFILTVRNSSDEWVDSLIRFHSKLWGAGAVPRPDDLKKSKNHTIGRPWVVNQKVFQSPPDDPYNRAHLKRFYENHNSSVKDFFSTIPDFLIEINLSEKGSYLQLCDFLNLQPVRNQFPKLNSSN